MNPTAPWQHHPDLEAYYARFFDWIRNSPSQNAERMRECMRKNLKRPISPQEEKIEFWHDYSYHTEVDPF